MLTSFNYGGRTSKLPLSYLLGITLEVNGVKTITALLQTLVRGSAELCLGAIYIDVPFPQLSSRPRLGILVH